MSINYSVCGWESGEAGEQWGQAVGAGASVTAGAAIHGAFGLRLNPVAQSSRVPRSFTSVDTVLVGRWNGRFPTSLPTGGRKFLAKWGAIGTAYYRAEFEPSDNTLRMTSYGASNVQIESVTGPVVVADAVHRIDVRFRGGAHVDGRGFDWMVDGVAQTSLSNASNPSAITVFEFGTDTAQTFTYHIDDAFMVFALASAPDAATVSGLYPRGEGYVRALKVVSNGPNNNEGQFSASSGTLAASWDLLNDPPYKSSAGLVQQNTLDTAAYLQYAFEALPGGETPHALSVVWERGTGVLGNNAKVHTVDGVTDSTIYNGTFDGGSVEGESLVPGQPFTREQIDGLKVRWGYSSDVSPVPQLGGLHLEVDVTLAPVSLGGGAGAPGSALVSSSQGWRPQPAVHFTVDDLPVDVDEEWALRSSAFGGYLTGEFRIPAAQVRRHSFGITAGAPVAAYTQTGRQVWEGIVALAPDIRDDGQARIETLGPWAEAEAAAEVLAYQIRGGERWAEGDEDPHGYGQSHGYVVVNRPGKLQFRAPKGEDFVNTEQAGFVLWIPGASFSRYAFIINKNRDLSNFDIRVQGGVGPSGSLTLIDSYTLGAGNPSGTEVEKVGLGGDYDLLHVQIRCSTDISSLAERLRVWLTSIRVNDRAEDDDMSASDVVTDVGEALGWDIQGVEDTSTNVLPLVWEEPWSELMLYMADLEDRFVRRDADGLAFGEWGDNEWEVLRSFSATPDLRALKVYNRVVIRYVNQAGKPVEAYFDADPDPISGRTEVIDYDLADPQPNGDLAEAMGERMIARYSQQRYAGTVTVYRTRDRSGPLAIKPGDVANVMDWGMGEGRALRIHEIEQRHDHASLAIESPISTIRLLEQARRGLGLPRRRGRNRR